MDAVEEREILMELVEYLSGADTGDIRAGYKEKMEKKLKSMELADDDLTTFAFGAKNEASMDGLLERARDRIKCSLKELKQLEQDR